MERWEAIKQRVDAALYYAGMTQEELVEKIKPSRSTYNRRRDGSYEWTEGLLYEIGKACKVPLWFLEDGWEGWRKAITPDELRKLVDELLPGEPPDD